MRIAYELWDVFTDTALSGNPLAVVPDASGLDAAQMQRIASEFNLSETSFVLPSSVADVRARYFTPARELPMAGHPSVGTVYALHAAGRLQGAEASLELGVGVVPMTLELAGDTLQRVWMNQGVPRLVETCSERRKVATALGLEVQDLVDTLPLQVISAGVPYLLVPVDSLALLAKASLNLSLLPEVLPPEHRAVFVFTFDAPDSDVRCRMFGEALGVREDPATGSVHGPLGWYLATHELLEAPGGEMHAVSHQGVEMGRPSELHLRVTQTPPGWGVEVGGQAVKIGEGRLYL